MSDVEASARGDSTVLKSFKSFDPSKNKLTLKPIEKAKIINDDRSIYGTFAEIGAGQEVVRFFFQAGGASGTVAKTMSAYDMKFSDAIYGAEKSYVCKERVDKMLEKEFSLLEERLGTGDDQFRYFVFANSVATGSNRRNIAGHGWVGMMFQAKHGEKPCKVFIHIRMLSKNNLEQQYAVGVVGVNLVHACYDAFDDPTKLIEYLGDGFDAESFEIDSISFEGPEFSSLDNRFMQIELVKRGLTSAVMFNQDGEISSPSELLFRKHVLALRGSYKPITKAKVEMLEQGLEHFKLKTKNESSEVRVICEITTDELDQSGVCDREDFLSRIDMLSSIGYAVMVSNHKDDFSLVNFLRRYSTLSRGLVLGSHNLHKILDKNNYKHLVGGLLEALGLMLNHGTTLFLYPIRTDDGVMHIDKIQLSHQNRLLLEYLLSAGLVEELDNHSELSYVSPEEIVELVKNGENIDGLVPEPIVKIITERHLYR